MSNTTNESMGIFTAIGKILASVTRTAVKTCEQAESLLDVSQDAIDTMKVHSSQMLEETKLKKEKQLAALESE